MKNSNKEQFILSKAKEIMETSEPWYVNYHDKIRLYSFEDEMFPNESLCFMYKEDTDEVFLVED